jgi:hypothetical protein
VSKSKQTPVESKVDASSVPSNEILDSNKSESKSSSVFVDSFVIPNGRRRTPSNLPLKNKSDASSQMENPSSVSYDDYCKLTKEQKRNLPDARDASIEVDGHPKLIIRYRAIYVF